MSPFFLVEIVVFLALLLACVRPLGGYMNRALAGELRWLGPVERLIYRVSGIAPDTEQSWRRYATSLLVFHLPGILLLYLIMRSTAGQPPDLAFNTAVSFATNTSWQSYAGETLPPVAQMIGITVQSFLSAAAGIAVAFALMRGFTRRGSTTIGNFWADTVRIILYILLPVCGVTALVLAWQGVPQTLLAALDAHTLEGATQTIALGPVASQEAVKLLSGDGGGFFNAQSAHPFENPNAFTNLLEMLLIPLLGAALTNSFGRMLGDERQGWALLVAMLILLLGGALAIGAIELHPNPLLAGLDPSQGNMEGKEIRFGIPGSSLFAELATATSSGAVNTMHDSMLPLSGLVLLGNMMLDEVIIGGPGSGLYGMLLFALLAVFIGGLMIGRTPEYVGNKIEAREVTMAMLAILAVPAASLFLTALAVVIPAGTDALGNTGPHGFSEILYAYTSAANTNGSSFAGLSTNTPFWNTTLALAMAVGRFAVVIPVLALAGSLATKRRVMASSGTLPTTGVIFVALLLGVIVIAGGLTYVPALALGPLAEHWAMGRF